MKIDFAKVQTETFRSRTFWAGAMAIATALTTLQGPERIMGVLGGLAVIFIRDAVSKGNVAADRKGDGK